MDGAALVGGGAALRMGSEEMVVVAASALMRSVQFFAMQEVMSRIGGVALVYVCV